MANKSIIPALASENLYKFRQNSNDEIFSIDTPPPTISGLLHIGHVFSYTHTDFIARFQRMIGMNVFLVLFRNHFTHQRLILGNNFIQTHSELLGFLLNFLSLLLKNQID